MSFPDLETRVTEAQRDRAVDYLQQAYAKGALDPEAFDERLGTALTAETRAELNASLQGLARIAPSLLPAGGATVATTGLAQSAANVTSGVTHLSGLVSGFVGPAIVKSVAAPGTRSWLEASRAMAFQLSMLVAVVLSVVLAGVAGTGLPLLLVWLSWFVGTIVLSTRAFNGLNSTQKVERLLPFKPEQDPRSLGWRERRA